MERASLHCTTVHSKKYTKVSKDNVDCASLALQVAPVSYYCLIFFIGLRPKLGYTYYHIIETISLYGLKLNHVIKNPFYYVLSIGNL